MACPNSLSPILFGRAALKIAFIHKKTQAQHELLGQARPADPRRDSSCYPCSQPSPPPRGSRSTGSGSPRSPVLVCAVSAGNGAGILLCKRSFVAKQLACQKTPGPSLNVSQRVQGERRRKGRYQRQNPNEKDFLKASGGQTDFFSLRESPYSLQQLQTSVIPCRLQKLLT